jgi:peptidoglycan/LPS O-acetylase OafA/YrhL
MSGGMLLPGGFIGVDIFFVISGYLITTLLMMELGEAGKISVLGFYERRARRLLPALLLVMLASLPFAWHYMAPEQLTDFSKSLLYSLFFSSNFYWYFSLQEYGVESALLKPFLHTWSLAVEEQYYIVFPLLLFSLHRFLQRYLVAILIGALIASMVFADWMTTRDQSFSFYMTPTRFWELLAGGLLAIYMLNNPTSGRGLRWQLVMPSIGMAMILASLIYLGYDSHHPGYVTIVPVLGTVLIILFKNNDEWMTRFLSHPIMVYLGLLSYSLYLWHYPIFAFGRLAEPEAGISQKAVWLILTLIFSALSYHFVEKPFRKKTLSRTKLLVSLSATSMIVVVFSVSSLTMPAESEPSDYVKQLIQSSKRVTVTQNGKPCGSGARMDFFGIERSCVFNDFPDSPTLVVVGDSHANAIAHSIRELARANQLNFAQVSEQGCPHLRVEGAASDNHSCFTRAAALDAFISDLNLPTIVYSAYLPTYLEPGNHVDNAVTAAVRKRLEATHPGTPGNAVSKTLNHWVENRYELLIVYPGPQFNFKVRQKLMQQKPPITSVHQLPTLSTSMDRFREQVSVSEEALDQVFGERVKRVRPQDIFCREATRKCLASEGDRVYFVDETHVSALGSDLIAREIARQLELEVPGSFKK